MAIEKHCRRWPGRPKDGFTIMLARGSLTQKRTRRQIRKLGSWFHNLKLNGVETAPDHFLGDCPAVKWRRFAKSIPADLRGASVLDVGCNGGFYSIEMKRRGASRVVGIDFDPQYLAQAQFAAEICGAQIEFRCLSVYDVPKLRENWVLFMGVFYHLRHPLLALDLLREHVVKDWFLFQSMLRGDDEVDPVEPDYPFSEMRTFDRPQFPRMHFIEHSYSGDPTNWWIPNRACVEAMLRRSGFYIVKNPEPEVYLCRREEASAR
jgi:tRNA (mo5U34)-methyltransferase